MNEKKQIKFIVLYWIKISESDNAISNLYPTLERHHIELNDIELDIRCIESSHWVQSYEETSFCSWLLHFEMVGQQEAKKLRIEKDELVHHVTVGILTNPTS